MTLSPGTTLDRYTLVALLGEGAQGAVWKATDPLHGDAPRALKLIPLRLARGQDLERIRREARLLAKLDHPGLCRCHGMFEDLRHEVLGFAMDYVEGQPLSEAIANARLTGAMRERVLLHIAEALAHVHEQGAVHRDIKLENVLLADAFFDEPEEPGHVKLVDFGVAALDGARQRLTATGHAVGTPAYMAPELIDPGTWGSGDAGPQADVFSFGVLAWKLFVGGHPTGLGEREPLGAYLMAYRRAAKEGAWPPRMAAKGAVRTLRRCLALHPEDRPAHAGVVAARIDEALGRPSSDRLSVTGEHALPQGAPGGTRIMTNPGEEDLPISSDTTPMAGPVAGDPDYPDIDTEPSGPPSSVRRAVEQVAKATSEARAVRIVQGPPSVGDVRDDVHPAPPSPSPGPTPSSNVAGIPRWIVVAFVVVVVALLVAIAVSLSRDPTPSPSTTQPLPSADPLSESADPLQVETSPPPPTAAQLPAYACNGDNLTRQGCRGSCSDLIRPDEPLVLRLYGVYENPSLQSNAAIAKGVWVKVCFEGRCENLENGVDGLPIRGEAITKGIDIRIGRGVTTLLDWPLARYQQPVQREDFRKGLSFVFRGNAAYASTPQLHRDPLRYVVFYLDPPGPRPARCPGAEAYLP